MFGLTTTRRLQQELLAARAETTRVRDERDAALDRSREQARALDKKLAELEAINQRCVCGGSTTPHTPRICACGHGHHAHTVSAPHSCTAFGNTCLCPRYRQLPHDEAVAQLKANRQAAAERTAKDGAA